MRFVVRPHLMNPCKHSIWCQSARVSQHEWRRSLQNRPPRREPREDQIAIGPGMDLRRLRARIAGTSGLIRRRQVLPRSLSRVRTPPGRMPTRWLALTARLMTLVFTLKKRWIRAIKGLPDLTSTTDSFRPRPMSRCNTSAMSFPHSHVGPPMIGTKRRPLATVLLI